MANRRRFRIDELGANRPVYRVADPALDLFDGLARIALVQVPIEVLGHDAKLDDEVVCQALEAADVALIDGNGGGPATTALKRSPEAPAKDAHRCHLSQMHTL